MTQIYAAQPGPQQARARQIYTELRHNIIENVHNVCICFFRVLVRRVVMRLQEYERTGYVWEQYDALSGEGRRRWVVLRCIPFRILIEC